MSAGKIEETFAALQAAPQDALRDLSSQLTVHVGCDGAVERTVLRSLVQATNGVLTETASVDIVPDDT